MQTYDHGTFLIVLDCADLNRAADFWCPALGYQRPYPNPGRTSNSSRKHAAASNSCSIKSPRQRPARTGSTSTSGTPDLNAGVTRLTDLGATVSTKKALLEHNWLWRVLADPDGNEFCALQPPTDFPWPDTNRLQRCDG